MLVLVSLSKSAPCPLYLSWVVMPAKTSEGVAAHGEQGTNHGADPRLYQRLIGPSSEMGETCLGKPRCGTLLLGP